MRKSGWAAAAGLVSAAMLLTACGGGSSSSNNAGSGGGSPAAGGSSGSGSNATLNSTAQPSSGSSSTGTGTGAHPSASATLYSPPPGVLYFSVRRSSAGYILTENGKPVYYYAGDKKGSAPTGTSSVWPSVHSTNPMASPADTLPGTLSTVGGVVTYNGYPLYTYGTSQTLSVHPSAQWKLIMLSASDIKS